MTSYLYLLLNWKSPELACEVKVKYPSHCDFSNLNPCTILWGGVQRSALCLYNFLPDRNLLVLCKIIAFAKVELKVAQIMKYVFKRVENIKILFENEKIEVSCIFYSYNNVFQNPFRPWVVAIRACVVARQKYPN